MTAVATLEEIVRTGAIAKAVGRISIASFSDLAQVMPLDARTLL